MAVRTGDREEGELKVITKARELIVYTYDRVHDKTLPKSDRWLASKSIWDAASGMFSSVTHANSIKVESREEANTRLLLEKDAIAYLDTLITWIDILNMKGIISDQRCEFWTKLATDTQNLAKAWLKANRRDYQKYWPNGQQPD